MKLFASDLHGTIVYNDKGTQRSVNETLESMDIQRKVSLQFIRENMGRPWGDYFTTLFPNANEDDTGRFVGTVRELSRRYEQQYERLMDHVADVLPEIKSRGYKVVVVSISTKSGIERALHRHRLLYLVDDVLGVDAPLIGGYDIGEHKGRQLKECIQKFDVDKAIMIGDREEDVTAGLIAGAMTVYFDRKGRTDPRAMYSIKDWRELLPVM